MQCPYCKGEGELLAFHVSYAGGSGDYNVPLKCSRCQGTGAVDDRMPVWIEAGLAMRKARVEGNPYRSLHAEAERRGISAVILIKMEFGIIEPIPAKETP